MDKSMLAATVYKRRSHRKYTSERVSEELMDKIEAALDELTPLYPEIPTHIEIVSKKNVRSIFPWLPGQVAVFFSDEREGYLENAGFMLQQLDLYIQSLGLGSCWVGMAKMNSLASSAAPDGMSEVMILAFGITKEELRKSEADFSRKALSQISDTADERLIPARLAPSSVNSQPWFFERREDGYNLYQLSLVRTKNLARMNRIDTGIALAHMYVSNPATFSFSRLDPAPVREKSTYIGTFTI